jgi:hypothetical protein
LAGFPVKSIRRESPRKFFGLPLWAIAVGSDWERGEMRGHARGIFAFGDIATGWFAFGGLARGFVAFGGLAIGLFAFGGLAIGILVAVGGGTIGGLAFDGAQLAGSPLVVAPAATMPWAAAQLAFIPSLARTRILLRSISFSSIPVADQGDHAHTLRRSRPIESTEHRSRPTRRGYSPIQDARCRLRI